VLLFKGWPVGPLTGLPGIVKKKQTNGLNGATGKRILILLHPDIEMASKDSFG
jgi:hypothetical protein